MSGFAERTKHIQSFRVMAILAEARQREAAGEDIIHLEVGEPDFPTPRPIIEAATQALNAGRTGYTPALGLPALREALAGYYQQRFAVSLNPKRIVLAPGASGALLLLTAARLNPGDGLLLADPGYPCNHHFGHLFGAHPQRISCGAEQQYLLTASDIDSHWQAHTKAALVASPANPTGAVYSPTQMQALVVAVSRQGGDLWVDEIYQELHFSDAVNHSPMTALQVSDEVVVINSFSKYFGMTGWRLGWAVIPEAWVETFDTLAQNLFL
ncbi:MAG: aminotransferase class I/II-fold pyridoxal phosphate-dependent enzyme, partial [Oleibacter sp.]|nr:aminotransferase class I/II-fold pyridoxal phosphate-dependent enzyme [Thalassolituus sp.]